MIIFKLTLVMTHECMLCFTRHIIRYYSRETGDFDVILLQVYWSSAKNYQYRAWFDKVTAKIKWCSFLYSQCSSISSSITCRSSCRLLDLGPPFRRSAIQGVCHSKGPPFRRAAIPEVCHSRGPPRKDAMGNRRLGPLDWINCYFLILYFMDFPPFLLLCP